LHIEAIEREQERSYEVPLKIADGKKQKVVNIKFDNGAAYTVIAASRLLSGLTEDGAERMDQWLSDHTNPDPEKSQFHILPYQKKFLSATGDTMTGYLVDAGTVKLGGVKLPHFFYYLIPRNKRSIALLGNDFLRYCQYEHAIEGSILITKMDENAYAKHYTNAISIDELAAVIDEII
jgi:hypothetical protein